MTRPKIHTELAEGHEPWHRIKSARSNHRFWLVIVPPLLSLALISAIKPSGPFAFWTETSIFCLCSLICGFALAVKQFDKVRHRILGTIAYSAAGMYLICCASFLGCSWLWESGPSITPAQFHQNLRQEEIARKAWVAKEIVGRDALADPSMLDLSPFYDQILPGTTTEGSFLEFQKPGTHIWDGIKFDVRGVIGNGWFVETNTISVGKKCSDVYFLHGAYEREPSNLVNRFFIHFQKGRTVTIPIICDVSSSFFLKHIAPTNAVVWVEHLSTNGVPHPYEGFFIKRWKNPFPDEIITSIGFAPQPIGFLVAITIKEATNSSP